MSNYAVMQNEIAYQGSRSEIAYPTIEPDVDDESDGDDWSPEDRVILTPQGRRELEK